MNKAFIVPYLIQLWAGFLILDISCDVFWSHGLGWRLILFLVLVFLVLFEFLMVLNKK